MYTSTGRILLLLLWFISASALAQNKTYYVSQSGSDSNTGTSESRPWKSLKKVKTARLAAGDKVLLKSGDRWRESLTTSGSGASGRPITFASYGSGSKPIVAASSGSYTVSIVDRSYVVLKDLHVIAPPTAGGIEIRGNAVNVEVRNCKVQGHSSNRSYTGIVYAAKEGGRYPSKVKITGNEVSGFFQGILGKDGLRGGGLIEGNYIHSFRPKGEDGIVAKRGNFEGLVIRSNEVKGWMDDGIDLYGGNNIIVEYNRIHDVSKTLNGGGNGIKGGGANAKSDNNIIRYNQVYNINTSSSRGVKSGINANGGDKMKIYGNLVYNVQGEGISIPSGSKDIEIYHNTIRSNAKQAIYVAGGNVTLRNNILWGSRTDLNTNSSTKGNNNLFINNAKSSKYAGSSDVTASASAVFVGASQNNYQLKSGSPAINKGKKVSGYTKPINGNSISGSPDIGAYEHGSGGSPAPAPSPAPTNTLKVKVDEDASLTLPKNTISLSAKASGTNGKSVSYFWTKKSGPAATLSKAATSKLDVRDMNEGIYVFSVKVKAGEQSVSEDVKVTVKPAKKRPTPSPAPAPRGSNGLRYRYYEGVWPKLPDFTNQSVRKEGVVANFDLNVRQREDDFGLVFTGSIQIDAAGSYTFHVNSDDGSQLYINGKLVVDNNGRHATRERSGAIYLSKGKHPIKLTYFEYVRNQVLEVRYAGPGISKQRIPSKVLFPEEEQSATPSSSPQPAPQSSPEVTANAGSDKKLPSANGTEPLVLRGWGKGPNPFRQYSWSKVSGPEVRLENSSTANVKLYDLSTGSYVFRFTATDNKGNSASDKVTLTVGNTNAKVADKITKGFVEDAVKLEDNQMLAYPNPAHRSLNVRIKGDDERPTAIFLRDPSGKVVRQIEKPASKGSHRFRINTRSLPPGVYVLQQADGKQSTKIVVQHE